MSYTTTVYSDGASHTVNAPAPGPVAVDNGSSVVVQAGASIPANDSSAGASAWGARGVNFVNGLNFQISGGTIAGGADAQHPEWGGHAAVCLGGACSVSGGTFNGGASDVQGYAGLWVQDPASVSVSGGTFNGGAGTDPTYGVGGPGAILGMLAVATDPDSPPPIAVVSGGSFTGGAGATPGYAIVFEGPAAFTVSGGSFSGGIALGLYSGGSVTFHGSGLAFSGGSLTGTLGGASVSIPVAFLNNASYAASGGGSSLTLTGT